METTAALPAPASDEVQRSLPRNFAAHLLNTSSLAFGASLISSGVILPLFVSNLSDSKLLVGLIVLLYRIVCWNNLGLRLGLLPVIYIPVTGK